jgi:hypothetical protein
VLHSLRLEDSVAFRTTVPPSSTAGEPVAIRLRLTNRTELPIVLPLLGHPPAFDIAVTRDDGTVLWRRPADAGDAADGWTRTLDPAETLTFEAVWDGRDAGGRIPPPGLYRVTGALHTGAAQDLVTLPTPFSILPVR